MDSMQRKRMMMTPNNDPYRIQDGGGDGTPPDDQAYGRFPGDTELPTDSLAYAVEAIGKLPTSMRTKETVQAFLQRVGQNLPDELLALKDFPFKDATLEQARFYMNQALGGRMTTSRNNTGPGQHNDPYNLNAGPQRRAM